MRFPFTTAGPKTWLLIVLALVEVLLSQNSWAQQQFTPRGPFVVREAQMTFPERAGAFRRVNVTIYTPDQSNVSAGYNSNDPSNPIIATIYVYPARKVLSFGSPRKVIEAAHDKLEEMELESDIREVLDAHRGAKLVDQGKIEIHAGGGYVLDGRQARFAYKEVFASKEQALTGRIWLFTLGDWYLKYRVTYPARGEARAMDSVKKFVAILPVPGV